MEKKIKLIWDFHGPESKEIAQHHERHLKEFIIKKKFQSHLTGVDSFDDSYSTAYLIVNEEDMIEIRDLLKPNRGEWVEIEN